MEKIQQYTNIIFGVDLDGVIRNFHRQHIKLYNELAVQLGQDDLTIPPNFETENYEWLDNECYKSEELVNKVWEMYQYELFAYAGIYTDALAFIAKFNTEIYNWLFITHQFTDKAKKGTYYWLERFFNSPSVVFCDGNYKHIFCDVLIDDKIENLNSALENKCLPICMARPWNTKYKGIRGDYTYIEELIFNRPNEVLQRIRDIKGES